MSAPIRIAKRIADAGLCSRREAERRIAEGRVTLNGKRVESPAVTVTAKDKVMLDGVLVAREAASARLFLYHKPRGLLTTHADPQGRPTLFEHLPEGTPRLVSVGRLDMDSEGLLLLTTSGALARTLELPETGLPRRYRARVLGRLTDAQTASLARGITVEGVRYRPLKIVEETRASTGRNRWYEVEIHEGKNREIRRVFAHFGLSVNRLVRIAYGPFTLDRLPQGTLMEIKPAQWQKALAKAGISD